MSVVPVSASKVLKLPFSGGLGTRYLYSYLPPGYDDPDARATRYPVLHLHDGQNCFETFSGDAFSGTWRADEAANCLILSGRLPPFIIVGVSNGGEARLAEYLPPYSRLCLDPKTGPKRRGRRGLRRTHYLRGRAHKLYADYLGVARFVAATFRVLPGREHTATCGSSMGGLFSAYLAFEHPEFARHHGVMSASFWTTRRGGELRMLERLRRLPVRDVRLWLDSGEGEGSSDDNKEVTLLARQALLDAGYREGKGFVYHLAEGATHSEAARGSRGCCATFSCRTPPRKPREAALRTRVSPAIGRAVDGLGGLFQDRRLGALLRRKANRVLNGSPTPTLKPRSSRALRPKS